MVMYSRKMLMVGKYIDYQVKIIYSELSLRTPEIIIRLQSRKPE